MQWLPVPISTNAEGGRCVPRQRCTQKPRQPGLKSRMRIITKRDRSGPAGPSSQRAERPRRSADLAGCFLGYPTLALPPSDRAVSWCALRHTSASKSGHRLAYGMATRIYPNASAAVGAPQAVRRDAVRIYRTRPLLVAEWKAVEQPGHRKVATDNGSSGTPC